VFAQPYLGVHASEEVKLYCILSPVGPYYKTGAAKPVTLLANPEYVRAWPGGVGNVKVRQALSCVGGWAINLMDIYCV
jgi:branched-chain amino acid aminotransferase